MPVSPLSSRDKSQIDIDLKYVAMTASVVTVEMVVMVTVVVVVLCGVISMSVSAASVTTAKNNHNIQYNEANS